MMKRFFTFVLISMLSFLVIASSDFNIAHALSEEERIEKGLTFPDANESYDTVKSLEFIPKTFEAYFHLPTTHTSRGGILFGNFGPDATSACFSFEIYSNGYPKVYYDVDNVGTTNPSPINVNFQQVDVRSNGYVHLVITHDNVNNQAHCYLNGELRQTVSVSPTTYYNNFDYSLSKQSRVGGDYRSDNGQYFKGAIKALEFYKDVRTADEVKADYERLLSSVPSDNDLICAYNFTQSGNAYLNDLSGNGYTIDYSGDNYLDVDSISYDTESRYITVENYDIHPNTFEAEILLPKSFAARAGVILGNWGMGSSLSFEVNTAGKPRLFYTAIDGKDKSIIFDADVRTGDWTHLAITHDMVNKRVYCYINGIKVGESLECYNYIDDSLDYPFVLGGDNRSGNEQYFKGFIKSVAVFSDVRSADEIKQDYESGVDLTDDKLIASYQIDKSKEGKDIDNLANNKYKLHYQTTWFTNKEEVTDYDYSFALVGDTQIIAKRYPNELHKIYDWIVDNKESKKIEYVFGLGDITDANTPTEWTVAKREISKLDGVVPYSLVRGNHDSSLWFNNTFYTEEYVNQFDGFYDDQYIDNSYNAFVVGDTDYLLITLDYGASDEELEWAGSVIEEHPNHRVIITTHCYMYRDGTTLGVNDVCPPADSNDANYSPNKVYNNGDQMWEKLVSQYGNIFLVLSGHDPCENVVTRQSEGIHGNTVTQMLIDPQGMDAAMGATGMVAMLYFKADGSKMEVEFYSTVHNQFFKESNQYMIDISNTGSVAHDYKLFTNDEYHWFECECGKEKLDSCKEHEYMTVYDENEHWNECECGLVEENSHHEHTYDEGKIVIKPTSKEQGQKEYSCTGCNKKYTEILERVPKKGCFGSIGISMLSLLMLFGVVLFIRRRKQNM